MKCVPAFVLAILFAVQLSANNAPVKVEFIEGSLGLAIQKAGQEGKLLFVEFGAKWCMPCRFMEQNTFRDQEIIGYMDANYVPVKIDIDDFDGFAYKQKYKVEALPTFFIMNSSGKILDRYEQSMAPSNLINILKEHNKTRNRRVVATELSPFELQKRLHESKKKRTNVNPHQASSVASKPEVAETIEATVPNHQTQDQQSSIEEAIQAQEHPKYEWAEVVEIPLNSFGDSDIVHSDEFLWEDDDANVEYILDQTPSSKEEMIQVNHERLVEVKPEITFYTASLNKFANRASADDYVQSTSSLFVEDTHIFERHEDGIAIFEVCLGSFATKEGVQYFIDKLTILGINGTVKEVKQ